MKTTKKILTLIFASVLLLSCEKESTTPTTNTANNSEPANAKIDVIVKPSQLASDQNCEDDKTVFLELEAAHFSTSQKYSEPFLQNGYVENFIFNSFTGLKAGTYTLTVSYANASLTPEYIKGVYTISVSAAQAQNGDVIDKSYTLTSDDICY